MTAAPGHTAAREELGADPALETQLAARLAALSLPQKVRLLTGADFWALHAEPVIGLRRLVTSDGPAGVRGERWDERDQSANVPSPTALAATWDDELVERMGRLLGEQARTKGVDVLLAPTINLHRSPYGGRHFECFSEDPLLTARVGAAYVRGVQASGVAATVKHFVANDSETERFSYDAVVDQRTLRELYLAPFELIVHAGRPWAVMAAYNSVDGTTMTESPLLADVLKGEWGFDGVVVSDWNAARTTVAAGRGGLDLAMPGPHGPWGAALVDAVAQGHVPEAAIDAKVMRLLRLAARVGALQGIAAAVRPPQPRPAAEVAALLRAAAASGTVLVRNSTVDGAPVLPLPTVQLGRVAVVGPHAVEARSQGGGSAVVFPPYTISPLQGIRDALGGDVHVEHAPGVRATDRLPVAPLGLLSVPDGPAPGVLVRFLSADGTELGRETRAAASFNWNATVLPDVPVTAVHCVEVRTRLRATDSGEHLLGVSGVGPFRLTVDAEPLVDTVISLPPDADPVEGLMRPPQHSGAVWLRAGQEVDVVVAHEARRGPAFGDAPITSITFQINVARRTDEDAELERAVALTAASDVAVVVVGTTEEVESEGFDRDALALPGRQDELVRRVAAVNPRTVVVVNAGAPVLLPWAEEVAAVLIVWFPGQEGGHALADVLTGAVEPGGRLPTTWPVDAGAPLPSTTPLEGKLHYVEGLHVGARAYARAGVRPRYWLGHGLGYTTWDYGAVEALPLADGARVTVRVRNTGQRRGREVVQVYASRPDSGVERPVRWLVGYAAVTAEPGVEEIVTVAVPARLFAHWDLASGGWAVEPGAFQLCVGRSAGEAHRTVSVVPGSGGGSAAPGR